MLMVRMRAGRAGVAALGAAAEEGPVRVVAGRAGRPGCVHAVQYRRIRKLTAMLSCDPQHEAHSWHMTCIGRGRSR